jgi:hypothetical protein
MPVGVLVLVALSGVSGALALLISARLLTGPGLVAYIGQMLGFPLAFVLMWFGLGGVAQPFLLDAILVPASRAGPAPLLIGLIGGVVSLGTAFGLARARAWAWWIALLAEIAALVIGLDFLVAPSSRSPAGLVLFVLRGAVPAALVAALLARRTRRHFGVRRE